MHVDLIVIEHVPTPWTAHGGYGRRSYDKKAKEKEEYRRQIKEQWRDKALITTPIALRIIHAMPIPSSSSKIRREQMKEGRIYHLVRPDVTNLNKLAEDTLKGIVISDDSIVVEITGRKFYSTRPSVHIWITQLTKEELETHDNKNKSGRPGGRDMQ